MMISFDAPEFEKYEINNEIGRGAFSVVHSAINTDTQEKVAIKSISKKFVSKQGWINLSREVEIMLHVEHPNILRLKEIVDTATQFHLIVEYMDGGELFDQIVKRGSFGEKDASKIVKQLLCGISYLHSLGVAHRDLKPENLLCSINDERVVVADFGLAKVFGRGELLKTHCGTPNYAAPEIVRGDKTYDKSVDMWSVGVITYVLLAGFFPFHHNDKDSLKNKIMVADFTFPDPQWTNISDYAKDFIRSLLVLDPTKRFTAEQALNHTWIEGADVENEVNLRSSMESFRISQKKIRESDLMVVE